MKITFLVSHTPNPRMYKRMNLAKELFQVSVIYWERSFDYYQTFINDNQIEKHKVIEAVEKPYCITIPRRIMLIVSFMRQSFEILGREKPAVIHAEHLDMLLVAYLFKLIYDRDLKIVYEVADLHEIVYSDSQKMKHRVTRFVFGFMEKLLCKKVDRLIVTSPFFWDDYYKEFFPKRKTLFIANAPERTVFEERRSEGRRSEGRRSIVKSTRSLTVGFIGTVRYFEQLRILIEAANKIDAVDVFIAGDGKDYKAIKEYVLDMSHITLYGAYDYETEIADLYERIDIVYSVYDVNSKNVRVALPNRLYEAIVAEKPIIVAKGTRLAKLVTELGIGFTVDSQKEDDLRALLENLADDTALLEEYKDNCRRIKDEFYLDHFNDQLREMYISLVKERAKQSK